MGFIMKKNVISVLAVFVLFAVGCKSGKPFGCSKDNSQPIDLRLGEPGKTEVINELPANDNVKTLDDNETITFTSDDGGAIITHNSSREINVGDIIIANPEQRYLVRVKEVLTRESGRTQTVLRQARIDDIVGVQSGSLKIESTPVYDLEDISRLERLAKTRLGSSEAFYEVDNKGRVLIRNLELFSVDINSDGRISGGANKIMGIPMTKPYERFTVTSAVGGKYRAVVNEAIIEIVPTLRSESEWKSSKISHLQTRIDTKVRYRVDITYEAAGEIQMEALIDAFMPKKVIPFRVAGPTPVYLDIELSVPAGASIKASKEGKTRVIYESEYDFFTTMTYDEKSGITTDKDQRVAIKDTRIETTQSDTKLEAEIFLKPQVTARLYRVVGPYAYLKPYVRGEIQWPSTEKKDDLFVGVTGGVGIELSEPIFVSQLVSYDSGKLFDFFQSFDLDKSGSEPAQVYKVGQRLQTTVNVDEVGPEGFVRFKLKEHLEDGFLRYELIEPTRTGLILPSESFYMDGDLFYYPMPHSRNETFKVRVYGKNNSFEDVEIAINVASQVTQDVSQDRYGLTTNSYQVSNGNPNEFKNQVPSYNLGGFTLRVAEGRVNMVDCVLHNYGDQNRNRQEARMSREMCQRYAYLEEDYYNFLSSLNPMGSREGRNGYLEEAQPFSPTYNYETDSFNFERTYSAILSEQLTQISKVDEKADYLRYKFLNLIHFGDYVVSKKPEETNCHPAIEIKPVNTETHTGFRLATRGCGDLIPVNPFNANHLKTFFTRQSSRNKWQNNNASWAVTLNEEDKNLHVVEITIEKSMLESSEAERLASSLVILLPINPMIRNLVVVQSHLATDFFKATERILDIFNLGLSDLNYSQKMIQIDFELERRHSENDSSYEIKSFKSRPNNTWPGFATTTF